MKYSFFIICGLLLYSLNLKTQNLSKCDLTQYVNPFIGTQGDGNTFPGVTYPFGMVKLGPDCDDLNSNMGYKSSGKIRGFSQLHVSGTGGGCKYGNILVYPFIGNVQITQYGSMRDNESAKIGYYSVELNDGNIIAELTSTPKVGIHRYTFNKPGKCGILIDAGSVLGQEPRFGEEQHLLGSEIEILSNKEIVGYNRVSGGWNMGGGYTVYFYALFDTQAQSFGTWKAGVEKYNNKSEYDSGDPCGAWFIYDAKKKTKIEVRVGISFISIGKAKINCMQETANLTFDQAVIKARYEWNRYLQRIFIEPTTSKVEKTKFYTALYHSLLQPTERTGENSLWKSNAPYFDDFYCIWDTYRTLHPLISLIAPEKEVQIVNSLIDIYKNEGYMPDGRSGNCNGRTQGGSNADIVVADAVLKDLPGINYEEALDAMLKDAEVPPGGDERKEGRGGLSDYKTLGYVSTNYERAGTRTLEYSAEDWAIAQCAKKIGRKDLYDKYYKRAANWENLWKPMQVDDGVKGFIMPKKANGKWDENFRDPTWQYYLDIPKYKIGIIPYCQIPEKYKNKEKFTVLADGSWDNFFYETDSWEYSFYVPHDMKRLINKCGGKDAFIARLDTFFAKGYYDITNEPGFLTPCLYIYAAQHNRTCMLISKLLNKYYTDKPDGLPGNDDSGALSSWYVFHRIGIFPNAGQDIYLITVPSFSKTVISLDKITKLTIIAKNLTKDNIYIKSASLNGRPWNKAWLHHSDIRNGGTLKFVMSNKPTTWGGSDLPPSRSDDMGEEIDTGR